MVNFEILEIGKVKIYLVRYSELEMDRYLSCLSIEERNRFELFQHYKRKKEFLATRILKHHFFPNAEIVYTELGAPKFKEGPFISISHCEGISAIAVSDDYSIGLDLELIADKAQRLHTKFLNEEEKNLLDVSNIEIMTRSWSIKESLYKLAQLKGAIFKKNLLIDSIETGKDISFHCRIIKEELIYSVTLVSKKIDKLIISINTNEMRLL